VSGAPSRAYLYVLDAGEHMAPRSHPAAPLAVLEASPAGLRAGANGVFYRGAATRVQAVHLPDERVAVEPELPLAFQFFTAAQRAAARECAERLAGLVPGGAAALAGPDAVFPLVVALVDGSSSTLYHFCDTAAPGVLFLRYHSAPAPPDGAAFDELAAILLAAHPARAERHHVLNDDCWYSRWPVEGELEARLVLPSDADPWRLAIDLHGDLVAGGIASQVPELDRSFRVHDQHAEAFETSADGAAPSLLVVAPGWDGTLEAERVTVTGGRLHRAPLTDDRSAPAGPLERRVRALAGAGATATPLASARRRRFAVHAESLATGAIHRISFEATRGRAPDGAERQLLECRIAYERSRTLRPMPDPLDEWRELTAAVRARLHEAGVEAEGADAGVTWPRALAGEATGSAVG
jgi:hypothetical protein